MMNIKSVENLYKKYNGKTLADDLYVVSREYNNFQNAFNRMAKDIAANINAEVVKTLKGYYDGSMFFKRGDRYVYVHYGNSVNRTHIDFGNNTWSSFIYCRTAKSDSDYTGGTNNFVSLNELADKIDKLLG